MLDTEQLTKISHASRLSRDDRPRRVTHTPEPAVVSGRGATLAFRRRA